MSGLNRFYLSDDSNVTWRKNAGIKCIFISHQKDDATVCRKIADYLINAGLDVYFDEYSKIDKITCDNGLLSIKLKK
jgi:hypothetical protein